MSHAEGDLVLTDLYLQASFGTDKLCWSLLFATPVFMAWHINLVATQAKTIDENLMPSYLKAHNCDKTEN